MMVAGAHIQEQEIQKTTERSRRHDRGLLLIGVWKLLEAVFFFLVGIGAFHLVHKDLADEALQVAARLRIDPDGRLVSWVMDHIDVVTSHRLRQIGFATFFYAAVRIAEGWGLVLEKTWAEWLVIGVTIAFLPWELYEIARHMDWIRVAILLINLGVLAYLVWWMKRMRRMKRDGLAG
ncbi:MAG TPA: DUF2127 domain-containing protein [Acidobacteriaceae bacterium]|nr:DUF2127 domain-containing protein [Acidobacteriaceae bacterium]